MLACCQTCAWSFADVELQQMDDERNGRVTQDWRTTNVSCGDNCVYIFFYVAIIYQALGVNCMKR